MEDNISVTITKIFTYDVVQNPSYIFVQPKIRHPFHFTPQRNKRYNFKLKKIKYKLKNETN